MVSASSNAFSRFQSVLKEVRTAQGAGTEAGKQIGEGEAQKILDAFGKLQGTEKSAAGAALKALLQNDVFEVTDGARGAFAKALGVDANELKPQAGAAGVKRTVLDHAFKLMSGPHKLDKAAMDQLKAGIKDMPKAMGDFLVHALNVGVADGDIKMEPEARKAHVKEMAERNRDGKVDMLAARFGEDFAKKVPPYVLSCLSSPPKFEELIFILMISLVSDTQKEVLDEQKRIAGVVEDDQKRSQAKEDRNKAFNRLPGATTQGTEPGNVDRVQGDPTKRGQQGHVERTKRQVEGAIGAIHGALKNGGGIDNHEARGIVQRLNRLAPAVKNLFAQAVGTAIEHSGVLKDSKVAANIKPIWEWAKRVAGVESFPKPTEANGSAGSLAKALLQSDRLEQRVAGFLVDSFLDKRNVGDLVKGRGPAADSKATVEKFQPLLAQMLGAPDNAALMTQAPVAASPETKGTDGAVLSRLERLADARPKLEKARAEVEQKIADGKLPADTKLPPSFEEAVAKTVDRECADLPKDKQEAMKAAVGAALEQLPKDRPANKEEIGQAFAVANGKVVDAVLDDKDPAVAQIVGGSIEKALQGAAGSVANAVDAGEAAPSPERKMEALKDSLAEQRAALVDEAKERGLDEKQIDGLARTFDHLAAREVRKLEQTGKIEPKEPPGAGKESVDPAQTDDTRSRQIMFENLKFKMNMLSEMMQSMSNILNTMHQNAENTIRAIR